MNERKLHFKSHYSMTVLGYWMFILEEGNPDEDHCSHTNSGKAVTLHSSGKM